MCSQARFMVWRRLAIVAISIAVLAPLVVAGSTAFPLSAIAGASETPRPQAEVEFELDREAFGRRSARIEREACEIRGGEYWPLPPGHPAADAEGRIVHCLLPGQVRRIKPPQRPEAGRSRALRLPRVQANPDVPTAPEGRQPARELRASRSFLPPHDFPPVDFAAYGIVAFPARAVPATEARHVMICEAYVATLPTPSDLPVPVEEQMVTVWPLDSEEIAARLQAESRDPASFNACPEAVRHYHLPTTLLAIRHALVDVGARDGPFLLAWSPSSDKGKEDALVLVADLSGLESYLSILGKFQQWREDIEHNPELWKDGWSIARLRIALRDWADRYGPAVLRLFIGGKAA